MHLTRKNINTGHKIDWSAGMPTRGKKVGSKLADEDLKGAALEFGKVAAKEVLGTAISNSIIKGVGITDVATKKLIETNVSLKIDGVEKLIEHESQDSKPCKE